VPIYGYRCNACGAEVEKRQSFHDDPLTTCETCGGLLRRVLHPVGIVFKGSGFYNTDNRKGGAAAAGTNADGAKSNGENGEAGKSSSESEKSTTPTSADSSSPSAPAPAKTESSTATPNSTSKT
jgi:putative FmdB family regulatory protein